MRVRKLKIFTVIFIALVILAAYGLAWLRTYTFKSLSPDAAAVEITPQLFVSAHPVRLPEKLQAVGNLGEPEPYGSGKIPSPR